MENVNIPVNYVAIHQGDYRELVRDSETLYRLKEAALSGIFWRRFSYTKSLEQDYDTKIILDALRFLFPDDYEKTVVAAKEAFLAAEAKDEEE